MNETTIYKKTTYSVMLGGGIFYHVTKQENSISLAISIDWANGEPLDSIDDFTPTPSDLVKLADLYALVSKEVNA